MCGKGSSNTVTQNTSQTAAPNPQAMGVYSNLLNQAQNVAATPYQAYPNQLVAPVNPQQYAGISNINAYQPSFGVAQNMAFNAAQPINASQIQQYMSPYTQNVVNATQAQFNNQNAQQQQQVLGNAAAQGALGGNRVGIAQAELANQQNLAQAPVIAGLENQGYMTGLNTALTEQQAGLSGAYGVAGIGGQALNAANQQIGAGTLEQQTQQQQDIANYQQFLLQMGYPFQTTQWLAGIGTGVGSQMGGTNMGYGTTTGPAPNYLAQGLSGAIGGLGLLGQLGVFSDRRLKENIKEVGKLNDGQKIYKFNYKGDPTTHVGLIAQEVEKKHPEAVGVAGGYKTVDYDKATEGVVNRQSGGSISPYYTNAGYVSGAPGGLFGSSYIPGGLSASPGKGIPGPMQPPPTPAQFEQMNNQSGSGSSSSNNPMGISNSTWEGVGKAASGFNNSSSGDTLQDYFQDLEEGDSAHRGGAIGVANRARGGGTNGIMSLDEMWDDFNRLTTPRTETSDGVKGFQDGGAPDYATASANYDDSTGVTYPAAERDPNVPAPSPPDLSQVPLPQPRPEAATQAEADTANTVGATLAAPPGVADAWANSEQKWGIPSGYLTKTAWTESRFNPRAYNELSGAAGPFQFMEKTGNDYGLSDRDRYDPVKSGDAAARLAAVDAKGLEKVLNRPPTAAELYLAHQQGLTGAIKLLTNPDARAGSLVGNKAIAWNGGNPNASAADFVSHWEDNFGKPGSGQRLYASASGVVPPDHAGHKLTGNETAQAGASDQGILGRIKDKIAHTDWGSDNPLWMSLMAAGAGGLSSRSPFFGNVLGDAFRAGTGMYYGQKLNEQQQHLAAKKLGEQADHWTKDYEQRQFANEERKRSNLEKEKIERAKEEATLMKPWNAFNPETGMMDQQARTKDNDIYFVGTGQIISGPHRGQNMSDLSGTPDQAKTWGAQPTVPYRNIGRLTPSSPMTIANQKNGGAINRDDGGNIPFVSPESDDPNAVALTQASGAAQTAPAPNPPADASPPTQTASQTPPQEEDATVKTPFFTEDSSSALKDVHKKDLAALDNDLDSSVLNSTRFQHFPAEIRNQALQVARGLAKVPPASGRMGANTGMSDAALIRRLAFALNPSLNEATYDLRKKVMGAYATSTQGQQMVAFNRMMAHTGSLIAIGERLHSLAALHGMAGYMGDNVPINHLINKYTQLGWIGPAEAQDLLAAFSVNQIGVAGEAAKVMSGQSGGGVTDRLEWLHSMSPDMPMHTLRSGLNTAVHMAGDALQANVDNYNSSMNATRGVRDFLTPKAKAILNAVSSGDSMLNALPEFKEPIKGTGTAKEKPPVKQRWNELIKSGQSEDEAYKRLVAEGYK